GGCAGAGLVGVPGAGVEGVGVAGGGAGAPGGTAGSAGGVGGAVVPPPLPPRAPPPRRPGAGSARYAGHFGSGGHVPPVAFGTATSASVSRFSTCSIGLVCSVATFVVCST